MLCSLVISRKSKLCKSSCAYCILAVYIDMRDACVPFKCTEESMQTRDIICILQYILHTFVKRRFVTNLNTSVSHRISQLKIGVILCRLCRF